MSVQFSAAVRSDRLNAIWAGSIGSGINAAAWVASTSVTALTSWCTNGGNVYLCTTSGTTAASGGPSGTGSNITDNTAHWTWVGTSAIGPGAKLLFYTGSQPANCATAASGTLLATLTLPALEESAASSGGATIAATWTGTASAAGTAGYFRIMDATNTTCHMQGSVGQGSGDMSFDNSTFTVGQNLQITGFTETDGNA